MPPVNDDLANAQVVSFTGGVTNISGTTVDSTVETGQETDDGYVNTVWYRIEVGTTGSLTIQCPVSSYALYAELYIFPGGGTPTDFSDLVGVSYANFVDSIDTVGNPSTVDNVTTGDVYYLLVTSDSFEEGDWGTFTIRLSMPVCLQAIDFAYVSSPTVTVLSDAVQETQTYDSGSVDPYQSFISDQNPTLRLLGSDIGAEGTYEVTIWARNATAFMDAGIKRNGIALLPAKALAAHNTGTATSELITAEDPPSHGHRLRWLPRLPVLTDDVIDIVVTNEEGVTGSIEITQICFRFLEPGTAGPAFDILDVPDYPLGSSGLDWGIIEPLSPKVQWTSAGGTGATDGTASSLSVTAGTIKDDILILGAVFTGGSGTLSDIPTPSGWTQIGSQTKTSGCVMGWFWKRCTADNEGATLTLGSGWLSATNTIFAARLYAVAGCDRSGTPWDDAQIAGPYTAANGSFPAVTVSGEHRFVEIFIGAGFGIGETFPPQTPYVVPSGWDIDLFFEGTNPALNRHAEFGGTYQRDINTSTGADTPTMTAATIGHYSYLGISFKPDPNNLIIRKDFPVVYSHDICVTDDGDIWSAFWQDISGGSSDKWRNGPILKRWNGSSWSVIDANIAGYPTSVGTDEPTGGTGSLYAANDFWPAVCSIDTDGTDIWIAYEEYDGTHGYTDNPTATQKNVQQHVKKYNVGSDTWTDLGTFIGGTKTHTPSGVGELTQVPRIRISPSGEVWVLFIDNEDVSGDQGTIIFSAQWVSGTTWTVTPLPGPSAHYNALTETNIGPYSRADFVFRRLGDNGFGENIGATFNANVFGGGDRLVTYDEWNGSSWSNVFNVSIEDSAPDHTDPANITSNDDAVFFGHGMAALPTNTYLHVHADIPSGGTDWNFCLRFKEDGTGLEPFTENPPGSVGLDGNGTFSYWLTHTRSILLDERQNIWLGESIGPTDGNAGPRVLKNVDTQTGGWLQASETNFELLSDDLDCQNPAIVFNTNKTRIYVQAFGLRYFVAGDTAQSVYTLGVWDCPILQDEKIPLILAGGPISLARIRFRGFALSNA